VTDIMAFVPAIRDGTRHKVWAKKIWVDFDVTFPADAVNTLPMSEHAFPVTVGRSDGSGIPGQAVDAEILDGPDGVFASTNGPTASLLTDANGVANFVLRNTSGMSGTNRVRFTANGQFYGEICPRSGIVTKTWQEVALDIICEYPEGPTGIVNRPFQKTIAVTNTGDAQSGNIVLMDDPDPGLTILEGGPFPMDLGALMPGETAVRTIRMMAAEEGVYTNRVSAQAAEGDATAENSCAIEILQGKLEIEKVCEPSRANAGSEVAFVVTVSNTGRAPLEEVAVRDDYPQGIEPASQDAITIGTLLPGESRQVIFMGFANTPGTYTNVARATALDVPEVTASCELTVVQCRLEMELTGPPDIYYGDTANFTVRVTNAGDGEAEACVVRVTTGACLGNVVRDFNVGPLAPGQSFTQDFAARAMSVGSCAVEADSNCGARCQIRRDVSLRVTGLPALQIEMIDLALDGTPEGIFRVGETFIYRLMVENDAGTEATPDLVAVFALPPELEFVSGRSNRAATVTGAGTDAQSSAFALGRNETITFDVQVRVVSAPASGLVATEAIVNLAADGTPLSNETESTTLKN
jgi:uncharacterized repeat protein (TIGR01451 family)